MIRAEASVNTGGGRQPAVSPAETVCNFTSLRLGSGWADYRYDIRNIICGAVRTGQALLSCRRG